MSYLSESLASYECEISVPFAHNVLARTAEQECSPAEEGGQEQDLSASPLPPSQSLQKPAPSTTPELLQLHCRQHGTCCELL